MKHTYYALVKVTLQLLLSLTEKLMCVVHKLLITRKVQQMRQHIDFLFTVSVLSQRQQCT
jgi:hypothetical protein